MAKNEPIGDNECHGAVRDRLQVFNPLTQNWIMRNADNGHFMDQKKDSDPFKGVC